MSDTGFLMDNLTGSVPVLSLIHIWIESRHDPRNTNSGKVMEKCGLKYEGTLRQSDINNQGICDAAWYSLLKEDYKMT